MALLSPKTAEKCAHPKFGLGEDCIWSGVLYIAVRSEELQIVDFQISVEILQSLTGKKTTQSHSVF